jgi:hypothetical protein
MLQTFAEFLAPKYVPPVRVGAVYALFSVYKTQICKDRVKIRLVENTWKELDELCKEMHDGEHYDVEFVIRHLRSQQAFYYTATASPVGVGSQTLRKESVKQDRLAEFLSRDHDVLKTVINSNSISALADISERYSQSKASLALAHPQATLALSVANSQMPTVIEKLLKEHLDSKQQVCVADGSSSQESSEIMQPTCASASASPATDITATGDQGLLNRRQAIRSKSFSADVRQRPKRQRTGDSSSNSKLRNVESTVASSRGRRSLRGLGARRGKRR